MWKYALAIFFVVSNNSQASMVSCDEVCCGQICEEQVWTEEIWHEEVEQIPVITAEKAHVKRSTVGVAPKECMPPDVYDRYYKAVSNSGGAWEGFNIKADLELYHPDGYQMRRCGPVRHRWAGKVWDKYILRTRYLDRPFRWLEVIHHSRWVCRPVYCPIPKPPEAPVPEPETFVLFGTGILGLAGYMRRMGKAE